MEFTKSMIITGKQTRVSKKTGNNYILYSVLNEQGETCNIMSDYNFNINPLSTYNITFDLTLGKFIGIKILDLVELDN